MRFLNLPLYHLRCIACKKTEDRIAASVAEAGLCACGGKRKRAASGPYTQVMERLDNGAMPRVLERLADAERLHADRAKNADPLAGGGTELPKLP